MKRLGLISVAFGLCAAASASAGCGSQPQSAASALLPFESSAPAHLARPQSRMPSRTKRERLLYVSDEFGNVDFYSYPDGRYRGELHAGSPRGLCSDKTGDVFVVDAEAEVDEIDEYSYGGTSPINILYDFGYYPFGCSVDPTTGNVAVAGGTRTAANIAVYAKGQGSPKHYKDRRVTRFYYCAYDSQGNLFTEGDDSHHNGMLEEIPKGGEALSIISVDRPLRGGAVPVQFDGTYLAIGVPKRRRGPTEVYQLKVSGATGTVVNTLKLYDGGRPRGGAASRQFWIQGNTILAPKAVSNEIGLWPYPAGGSLRKLIKVPNTRPWGLTISVAPRS
jgi:hypothetical protein